MLPHSFTTKSGYSGSPIIVRFMEESWQQYIVAIHSCVDYENNSRIGLSTKMTMQVVERLISFERKLKNSEVSMIKFISIEFERCLEKI